MKFYSSPTQDSADTAATSVTGRLPHSRQQDPTYGLDLAVDQSRTKEVSRAIRHLSESGVNSYVFQASLDSSHLENFIGSVLGIDEV